MSRQKYRIWDKQENKWYQPKYEAYNGKLQDLCIGPSGDFVMHEMVSGVIKLIHESIFKDRFESVWFTGLKDRNGKEIFEGDICSDGHGNDAPIEWVQEHCQFLWIFPDDVQEIGEWCEIIGNRFEHPELLEDAK